MPQKCGSRPPFLTLGVGQAGLSASAWNTVLLVSQDLGCVQSGPASPPMLLEPSKPFLSM